jgi:hypothetical protein
MFRGHLGLLCVVAACGGSHPPSDTATAKSAPPETPAPPPSSAEPAVAPAPSPAPVVTADMPPPAPTAVATADASGDPLASDVPVPPAPPPVTGKVQAGQAAARGRLDPALINKEVRAHLADLQSCYEGELRRDPSAKGRIVADFTIGNDGRVAKLGLGGAWLPAIMGTCMSNVLSTMRFPPPDGGTVTVQYPFVFGPG